MRIDYYRQIFGILHGVSFRESEVSFNGQTIPAGIGDGVHRDHIFFFNPGSQVSYFSQFVFFYIIGIISSISAVASSINNTDIFAFIFAGGVDIITF